MSRTNSSVQFQAVSLVAIQMLPCINHNWRRATTVRFDPARRSKKAIAQPRKKWQPVFRSILKVDSAMFVLLD
jgi:hypothetical protein